MDNLKNLALRAVTLVAFVSCGALAQTQAPAQAPPPAGEPYQHIPLPAQLPKGVSVKDAQHLQALIDDYNLQEPLVTTKIKDNVYMVRGGPGRNVPNSGFIVGKTSVIVVGNKNSKEAEEGLLAEVAKVTPKPVKTVIILHSEHESGVGFLPAGLTIIAHENAKKEMEVSTARDKVPADRFPTKTAGKNETMTIDGVRVRLLHWGPGYTGGDLIVFLPAQKVVFAGDLVVSDFPLAGTFVDHPVNGTVAGWLANIKGMLTVNFDYCVPGHGAVFTKNDVRTKLAFVQDKWDKIKAMVAQGESLDRVKAAMAGTPEKNPNMTEVIYSELTAKSGE
jgi:glyoxylase-like metal-dependent hydrolase (beta-lactamase superfamily II)